MNTEHKPKRVTGFISIGVVFLAVGIWMWVSGMGAIRSGKIIPGGGRARAMTGTESVLLGSAAVGIGAYGVWLGMKGKRH
jgi:hypothetical protein